MAHFRISRFPFACAAALLFALPAVALAQTGMTYEAYQAELAEQEEYTAETRRKLAECRQATDERNRQMADIDAQIAATKQDIYRLVEADQITIDGFFRELDRVEARLMGLMSLPDDALFGKRDEFDDSVARAREMKESKIGLLPDAQKRLRNIDSLIERINARMPARGPKPISMRPTPTGWRSARWKRQTPSPTGEITKPPGPRRSARRIWRTAPGGEPRPPGCSFGMRSRCCSRACLWTFGTPDPPSTGPPAARGQTRIWMKSDRT